jgi:hypothetical protein
MTARTQTIIYVAVGLIVALIVGFLILGFDGDKPTDGGGTTDINAIIQIPIDTSDPTDTTDNPSITPPVVTDPADDEKQNPDTTDTNQPPKDDDPKVEDSTEEEVKDTPPVVDDTEREDKVVSGEKDKNTVETGPASGEDRNDEIIKEKEDKAPVTEGEEDTPVIVEDEKTSTEGGGKGDAQIKDEEPNIDDDNKNGPVYNPSIGGDNPFNNDTETEINDKPVEDYVGEGEDRPGEGIHF